MSRTFLAALILITFLTPPPIDAKIAFLPLAERVAKADLVGIVECETAGATVAKYKVIESCRGAKAGETIHIRTFVRFTGPQFRVSLCGERYFVVAVRAASHEQWSRMGANVPIAMRDLHADYDVAYGQGPMRVGPDTPKLYEEAKKLVAAQKKPEFQLPKPAGNLIWTAPPKPGEQELAALRKVFAAGFKSGNKEDYSKAKDILHAHDPGPFFKELLTWEPEKPIRRIEMFHAKASYAAWRCAQDREKHLKMLLEAREPIVRVAGAVYLCFDNEKAGKEELAKLTKLEEEAGAWAALTLARRGDKNAVPRMIEIFKGGDGRLTMVDVGLRFNAQVLLSNSAKHSGVIQPPRADPMRPWGHQVDYDELRAWWQQNSAKITLNDPWLDVLSKQKVD